MKFHPTLLGFNGKPQRIYPKGLNERKLTKHQKKLVEKFMTEYESPMQLIIPKLRGLYNVALSLMPFEDIEQCCYVGLIQASKRFDRSLGFKFSTQALWWMRNAIQTAIRNSLKAKYAINDPDTVKISELETGSKVIVGLEGPVADYRSRPPVDVLENDKLHWALGKRLTERERTVISMRYGLTSCSATSRNSGRHALLEDVAKVMGVTRERVRQIELRALEKLQLAMMEKVNVR